MTKNISKNAIRKLDKDLKDLKREGASAMISRWKNRLQILEEAAEKVEADIKSKLLAAANSFRDQITRRDGYTDDEWANEVYELRPFFLNLEWFFAWQISGMNSPKRGWLGTFYKTLRTMIFYNRSFKGTDQAALSAAAIVSIGTATARRVAVLFAAWDHLLVETTAFSVSCFRGSVTMSG